MEKTATVYLRRGQFLVHASSRTVEGLWILWQPCLALPETSDDRELGLAIRAALDGSRVDVPHPRREEFRSVPEPLFRLASVTSWKAFASDATSLDIEEEGERLSVVPAKNLGPRQGFEPDPARQVVLPVRASPEELGEVTRRLLA